jgi:hypothetical protein
LAVRNDVRHGERFLVMPILASERKMARRRKKMPDMAGIFSEMRKRLFDAGHQRNFRDGRNLGECGGIAAAGRAFVEAAFFAFDGVFAAFIAAFEFTANGAENCGGIGIAAAGGAFVEAAFFAFDGVFAAFVTAFDFAAGVTDGGGGRAAAGRGFVEAAFVALEGVFAAFVVAFDFAAFGADDGGNRDGLRRGVFCLRVTGTHKERGDEAEQEGE